MKRSFASAMGARGMSHPDEGTIHAWLDRALAPEEAEQLEAHVATCSECQAAVAEARGLIAASSRILGALDNVPSGVVPKSGDASPFVERLRAAPAGAPTPVPRWSPRVWAMAATVVMMVGVGVVVRNSDQAAQIRASVAPAAPAPSAPAPTDAKLLDEGQPTATVRSPSSVVAAAPAVLPAPANGPVVARRPVGVAAASETDRAGARSQLADARGNAASQAAGGAGAASGVVRDVAEPTSTVRQRLSEQASKDVGDQPKRSDGFAAAVAGAAAEKKVAGELRRTDKQEDAIVPAPASPVVARTMAKAAVAAPAPAVAPAETCAQIAIGAWRSTSSSVAHGPTTVIASPGPTANAPATVTLQYADGSRTEAGVWLLQPDTARLTVRDTHDTTMLRLLLSRSALTGIAVLTSATDNAMATATARLVPDGCVVTKPK
jgi:hypothetical protein